MTLYVGEGLRGSNGAHSTLERISVTPCATHNQIGPLWCWFPSGWACAHSRPPWVSPTTSPVRLGVSPAAAPTPTGVFTQRFEALFPHAGSVGCSVCFAPPPIVPVYLWANVGPQGLLVVRLPALFVPHSTSLCLGPARATRVLSAPAAHLCPSYRSGWMFLFYLLGVRLPCCLIFCQSWLCEEAQCLYLHLHLGSKSTEILWLKISSLFALPKEFPFSSGPKPPSLYSLSICFPSYKVTFLYGVIRSSLSFSVLKNSNTHQM